PASVIARLLGSSRTLILSSRWESGPIVASEALCMGCSLVGPSWVPTIPWYCGDGRHGRVFTRRSPSLVAGAVVAEMAAWAAGGRDPRATAAHFRPRFAPAAVCRRFMAGSQREADARAVVSGGSSDD